MITELEAKMCVLICPFSFIDDEECDRFIRMIEICIKKTMQCYDANPSPIPSIAWLK